MRNIVLGLTLAVLLAACGLPVQPVNHSCASNPAKANGSGCQDSHHD